MFCSVRTSFTRAVYFLTEIPALARWPQESPMKPDDLRAALQREPFLSFDLHTRAGRSYPVAHPEDMAFSPHVEAAKRPRKGSK